jgi:hemerythrin
MDHASSIKLLTDSGAMMAASHREHDAIEDALDTLGNLQLVDASKEIMLKAVDLAMQFFVSHFESEEAAFAECRFPGANAHIRSHAKMLRALGRIRADIVEGSAEAPVRLQDLLNAFHNHVDHFDRSAYAAILAARLQNGEVTAQGRVESERLARHIRPKVE